MSTNQFCTGNRWKVASISGQPQIRLTRPRRFKINVHAPRELTEFWRLFANRRSRQNCDRAKIAIAHRTPRNLRSRPFCNTSRFFLSLTAPGAIALLIGVSARSPNASPTIFSPYRRPRSGKKVLNVFESAPAWSPQPARVLS